MSRNCPKSNQSFRLQKKLGETPQDTTMSSCLHVPSRFDPQDKNYLAGRMASFQFLFPFVIVDHFWSPVERRKGSNRICFHFFATKAKKIIAPQTRSGLCHIRARIEAAEERTEGKKDDIEDGDKGQSSLYVIGEWLATQDSIGKEPPFIGAGVSVKKNAWWDPFSFW